MNRNLREKKSDLACRQADPKKALLKAQKYCAYQERCQQEVRERLYKWGVLPEVLENTIAELITANFINEERFAKVYAGGKFRIKKWGRIKIAVKLQSKNISEYCINKGLEEIDDEDYMVTLKEVIEKKARNLNEKNDYLRKNKIARCAIRKGFESELVWEVLKIFKL